VRTLPHGATDRNLRSRYRGGRSKSGHHERWPGRSMATSDTLKPSFS
jgi:hypothetical protein